MNALWNWAMHIFFTQFRIEKRKQLFFLLLLLHGTHNNVNNRMLLQHSSTHKYTHTHARTHTQRVTSIQQGNSYGISTLPRSLVSPEETVEPKVKKEKLQISLSIHPCLIDRCINSHNRWGCSNYSIGRVLNPLSKNKVLFLEESFFFVSIFHLLGRNCNILKLKSIYGFFSEIHKFECCII